MTTIETTQQAGDDKFLRLAIPVDKANERYHLVIVLVPESENAASHATANNDWPEGYFERTYGSIKDESFVRHPQGDYEARLELE